MAEALVPYINNAAEGANSIWSIDGVSATASILHNGTCDHDDILGGAGQLLNDQVDHLTEACIFVLEQLRDAKEKGRRLGAWELLAGVEEEGDLC